MSAATEDNSPMFVSVHVVQFGQDAIEKAHKYALHLVVSRKVSQTLPSS